MGQAGGVRICICRMTEIRNFSLLTTYVHLSLHSYPGSSWEKSGVQIDETFCNTLLQTYCLTKVRVLTIIILLVILLELLMSITVSQY